MIDAEASAFMGAAPFERTSECTTHRNALRSRTVTTNTGDLYLRIPKLGLGLRG
ncbi:MAG: transposase [Salinibacterium sp.]|nr:transposase [Salinibacterium sp.]